MADETKRTAPDMPGKTPGKAEGGDDDRSRPYPNEPGKTPGQAEGDDDSGVGAGKFAGEEFSDPSQVSGAVPRIPDGR